jgi:hypothetical protein
VARRWLLCGRAIRPRPLPSWELAYNTFRDWATHSRSFRHAGACGSSTWTEVLRGVDESVRLASTAVSATFFDTLDARPMLGRTLSDLGVFDRLSLYIRQEGAICSSKQPT